MEEEIDNERKEEKNGNTGVVDRIKECSECGSKRLIYDYDKAEIFCQDCGMVIEQNIVDLGPEWHSFNSEQLLKKARTGPSMTYRIHDKGLSTATPVNKIPGLHLPGKWKSSSQDPKEKTFTSALIEIGRIATALNLPDGIKEDASLLFRKFLKKKTKFLVGRGVEAIAAALVYISCRQCGVPRTLEEMRDVSRVGQKKIKQAYFYLLREFNLKVPPASPIDFVPRFCSKLNLSGKTREKAIEIIKKAKAAGLTNGRRPMGIVAAAIYIAAETHNEKCTQKDVSNVCGVTEPTIRNKRDEIETAIPEILSTERWVEKLFFKLNEKLILFTLEDNIKKEANEVIARGEKAGELKKGKTEAIAVAALIIAVRNHKRAARIRKEILEIASVTRPTIQQREEELKRLNYIYILDKK